MFHSPIGLSATFVGLLGLFLLLKMPPEPIRSPDLLQLQIGIPNLNLRAAAQIDAAVAVFFDLPIDVQLEVAVVFVGAKILAFAVENDHAVFDAPMGLRRFVRQLLRRREFVGRQTQPLRHRQRRSTSSGPWDLP